jgi:hypothetical protein
MCSKFLSDKGLLVNAEKSTFCADEIEYLGYWVSRSGIQPITKKLEAIKKMVHPTTCKELRRFIGMVNYYRDMWVHRSELLAPLTSMTSKNGKFNWTDEHQKVFENIKKIICREVMLTFLDFSKPQVIHIYVLLLHRMKNLLHFIVENLIVLNRDIQLVSKNYCQ